MGDGAGPAPWVLEAFGTSGPAEPLPGGQGTAWRTAGAVLKPAGSPAEVAWRAEVLTQLPELTQVRVARPLVATSGGWTVDGWEAWQVVAGEPDPTRVEDVLAAGDAFHVVVADVGSPPFLSRRADPWTYGDRVAWGELPLARAGEWGDLSARLLGVRRPVDLPTQPVHGDLLGNVLFDADRPPAVIDWAVYERPPLWASAVVVVDAITWHDGNPLLVQDYADGPEWPQMLVRALLYRMLTNVGRHRSGLIVTERPAAYERVVDLVVALAR